MELIGFKPPHTRCAERQGRSIYVIMNPPPNFSFIEDCICRCTTPIARQNWSFLQTLYLGTVLNISGDALEDQLAVYLKSNNIQVNNFFTDSANVIEMEEWVKRALECIFLVTPSSSSSSLASNGGPLHSGGVLIVGSPQSCTDCLLVACLRRVQDWSLVSILAEFRMLQGPLQKRSPYAEQVVEHFDKNIIDSTHVPDFIAIHRSLLREEESLVARLKASTSEASEEEQLLQALFFSPPNVLLTSHSTFSDETIVDDKDDD